MTDHKYQALEELLKELDARGQTPPSVVGIGADRSKNYGFLKHTNPEKFLDILKLVPFHDDPHTEQKFIDALTLMAQEILAIHPPEAFHAFVCAEDFSVMGTGYPSQYVHPLKHGNAFPTIPGKERHTFVVSADFATEQDPALLPEGWEGNTTAHEAVGHFLDGLVLEAPLTFRSPPVHSQSPLLLAVKGYDLMMHPEGMAKIFEEVREAAGHTFGYHPHISDAYSMSSGSDQDNFFEMYKQALRRDNIRINSEEFAIAVEYYFGTNRPMGISSPLLEAYMEGIVSLHIEICNLDIAKEDKVAMQTKLRETINDPTIVPDQIASLREEYTTLRRTDPEAAVTALKDIETALVDAIRQTEAHLREQFGLTPRTNAKNEQERRGKTSDDPPSPSRAD